MKKIPLTQGYSTMIDDADFDLVSRFKWHVKVEAHTSYAARAIKTPEGKKSRQALHRFLMGVEDRNIQVDHRDGNGLNNQRQNLRVCTNNQNQKNKRIQSNNKTGFKGVRWIEDLGKFFACYGLNGRDIFLGSFTCPKEAARHYNRAAKEHGEGFELLNDVDPLFPTIEYLDRQKRVEARLERIKNYLIGLESGIYDVKHLGVSFRMDNGKWAVEIKQKKFGCFLTQDEAIAARDAAVKKGSNGNKVGDNTDKLRN